MVVRPLPARGEERLPLVPAAALRRELSKLPTVVLPSTGATGEDRRSPEEEAGVVGERAEGSPVEPRFRVEDEVGRGGMGRVVRVADRDLNREVAIKVLLGSEAVDADQRRRFVEEAQITAQLEHPGVVPVHDLGLDAEGNPFFSMRLVRGHTTLAQVIAALRGQDPEVHARYTFERRVQVIQRVCHVLHHAHRRGVVHRDIKPDNVVLGQDGEVYLLD